MTGRERLRIEEPFSPESAVGKLFTVDETEFEIVAIMEMGMEKIVYELRDTASGELSHVLKIYRERLDQEAIAQKQDTLDQLRDVLGREYVVDTRFVFVDGWPIEFEPRYAAAFHAGQAAFYDKMDTTTDDYHRIVDLYRQNDFEQAYTELDQLLEQFPLNPDFLELQALCLLAMGRPYEALDAINMCLEVEGDEARHYINFASQSLYLGYPTFGRLVAVGGVPLVSDKETLLKFLIDVERGLEPDQAGLGNPERAAVYLKELTGCELPASELATYQEAVEELEAMAADANVVLEEAWEHYAAERFPAAALMVQPLAEKQPFNIDALTLSGHLALRQERWSEAVETFGKMLWLDLTAWDVCFYLGYAFLALDDVEHAAQNHQLWLDSFLKVTSQLQRHLEAQKQAEPGSPTPQLEMALESNSESLKARAAYLRELYGDMLDGEPGDIASWSAIVDRARQLEAILEEVGWR